MLRVSAVQPSPAVTILRLEGRLERQVTGLLSDQVHAWLAQTETVVLDLEGVVFIDARRDGTPGEIRCEDIAPSAGSNPLAHSLSPQALLLYAEQLYGRAPRAVVLSIAGERFGMGEELSPVVRRALPRAIRAVIRQAKSWAQPSPQPSRPA
mgnify:CR=1 FL=1